MQIIENNWLNLTNFLKKILILTEIVCHLKNKKVLNELAEGKSSEFRNLENKINPDNSIYKYKTEEKSPKDFSVCQNPTEYLKI